MSREPEPGGFQGTAMNGAVGVLVDGRGLVLAVRLHPQVVNRLGPQRLARGVVAAHAQARAAAAAARWSG